MTDTPKILRDMTDAEIGALVRADGEGHLITYRSHGDVWLLKGRGWDPYKAYRIAYRVYRMAPPKFLPLEVGKSYRTEGGDDWTCKFIEGDRAYCVLHEHSHAAYIWDVSSGSSKALGDEYNITGLSENKGAA